MTHHRTLPDPRRRRLGVGLSTGLLLAVGLTACSSGGDEPQEAAADPTVAQQRTDPGTDRPAGQAPGVSGTIAAVTGTTAQVQSSDTQTAVTWTDGTTVQVVTAATLADVTAGSCVMALTGGSGDGDGGTGDGETGDGAAGAATTVAVSTPGDDGCDVAGGFPGGAFGGGSSGGADGPSGRPTDLPSDLPTGRPSGRPSGVPSGAPSGFGPGGGRVLGTVVSVDGSTVTARTTGADGQSEQQTFTVDPTTTYTLTAAGTTDAVVVGQCMTALGDEDDSGTLTATSLTVSAPGDDGCNAAGPGGRAFGGPRGGQGADDAQGAAGA